MQAKMSFCYRQSSLECCTYTPFSNHENHSSSQVTHSSIPSSPVGYVSSRANTFSIAAMLQSALSLSLYYSLYLINEEQAHCLCLFITSLDVTFEDKETSLMIHNISYTLCTDSKL